MRKSNTELFFIGLLLVVLVIGLLFLTFLKNSKENNGENIITLNPDKIIVVDGDTIKFKNNTKYVVVRIVGIDTPEYKKKQKEYVIKKYEVKNISCLDEYGILAKEKLEELIKSSNNITIEILGKDKYGRFLGKVYVNGSVDIAELLTKEGYAFLYTKDKYYYPYVDELEYAKNNKLGLWSCIN